MNLAGYIRVSSEVQVDAYGKAVQRNHIANWASLNGHTITAWFEEDGVSGKTDDADRPALHNLLTYNGLEEYQFEGMVVFDATRIARRLYIQETLLNLIWATGLRVFSTTNGELEADEDDPMKILIRQVVGAVAEFEHRSTVIKLHAARRIKASQGGYVGGTPKYGLHVVGTGKTAQFEEDAVESSVIEIIVRLHGCGFSLRQIADHLNGQLISTKRGKTWKAPQVQRIIQRQQHEQP